MEYLKTIESFLTTFKEVMSLSTRIIFAQTQTFKQIENDMTKQNAFKYKITDKDDLLNVMPHPYNKKAIFETLESAFVHFPLNQHHQEMTMVIEVGQLPDKDSVPYNTFKRDLLIDGQHTDYYSSKTSAKFHKVLMSETGFKDFNKALIKRTTQFLDEISDIKPLIRRSSIFDDDLSDDDYKNLLYSMMLDGKQDLDELKQLFENQLTVLNVYETKKEIRKRIKNTKLRHSISDNKIKTLLNYVIIKQLQDDSIITLLNSKIPDRYIISRDMRNLNLKPVKLGEGG